MTIVEVFQKFNNSIQPYRLKALRKGRQAFIDGGNISGPIVLDADDIIADDWIVILK
jgi:hypothetical protein